MDLTYLYLEPKETIESIESAVIMTHTRAIVFNYRRFALVAEALVASTEGPCTHKSNSLKSTLKFYIDTIQGQSMFCVLSMSMY